MNLLNIERLVRVIAYRLIERSRDRCELVETEGSLSFILRILQRHYQNQIENNTNVLLYIHNN